MHEIFSGINQYLEHHPNGIISIVRTVSGFSVLFIVMGTWIVAHRRAKKRTHDEDLEKIEAHFEKNEDGLYPWEVNTDDDPKNMDKNAQPDMDVIDYFPQRGRWKI